MKSTPLLAALLLLFAWNTQSQVTTYNIGNYKLPPVTWQALETTFGLMGNNIQYNSLDSESQNSLFSGNLDLNYRFFRNTQSMQRTLHATLASGLTVQNDSYDERVYRSRAYNPRLFLYSENRMYLGNQLFYEINAALDYGHEYQKRGWETEDRTQPQIHSDHSFAIAIPLKMGAGRIEPVQDARQAIYILEALSGAGRLDENITDQQVVELSQLISRLRNKRFLDFRLGWMEQIETLDSFLLANEHITLQDARYFTTLTDLWNYGNYPHRSSGNRISLAVYPRYLFQDFYEHLPYVMETTDIQTKQFQLNTGIEFVHEKPLNLYWQNSVYAHAYYKYHTREQSNTSNIRRSPGMEIMLAHQIGLYPNTRTRMTLNNSLTYDNTKNKIEDSHSRIKHLIFDSSLGIDYYFSPQLRISGYSTISYNRNRQSYFFIDQEADPYNHSSFGHHFRVEVIYKIF